jgi:glycosyltransferase involved in cell wall biosynthesis
VSCDESASSQLAKTRARGKITVCTIARLALPKRFDLFVAAAKGCPEMSFFWIGNRTEPQSRLPDNLMCLGDVPTAKNLLREADIFCLFSDYEGLPMSVLEALCAGKPVVASDVGGIREALSGNESWHASIGASIVAGVLVANNEEEIVNAFRMLGSDAKARETLSCIAKTRYDESFSSEKMYREYQQLYRRLSSANFNSIRIGKR